MAHRGTLDLPAPPDGTARLALVAPAAGSEEAAYIGKARQIVFLTENVEAKYRECGALPVGIRFAVIPFRRRDSHFEKRNRSPI